MGRKSLEGSETPEQRRERLKALAKARVDRLVAGEVLTPHADSSAEKLSSTGVAV
jgi:hypothetical protein